METLPPTAPADLGRAAQALHEMFAAPFSVSHQALQEQAARRRGPLQPDGNGLVRHIDTCFPLVNMTTAINSLAEALCGMASSFQGSPEEFASSAHLLRYVGAPGIGKTTAVVNVPSMLLPHLQRAHDTPETWGKYAAMGGDELYTRLQSWCTPRGPLVFHIDFNAYYEMMGLISVEQGLFDQGRHDVIVALRMLYATVGTPRRYDYGYDMFLRDICERLPWWWQLAPRHVCAFVQLAAGLDVSQPSLAFWTYDGISGTAVGAETSSGFPVITHPWFPHILSASMEARQAMHSCRQAGLLDMLPVFIATGNRAAAASLQGTASASAKVKDLRLARMGPEDRQAVVMDLVRRLDLIPRLREQVNVDRDQPFEEVKEQLARACPAPICELLQLVGSNPRTLGFALAYLSRRHRGEPSLYVSRSADGMNCKWLDSTQAQALSALSRLAIHYTAIVGWRREYFPYEDGHWEGILHSNLRRLFALCITGRMVARNYTMPAPPNAGLSLQLLETQGYIELVAGPLPGSSRAHGGPEQDRYWECAAPNPDDLPRLRVSMSPLLALAAREAVHGDVGGSQRMTVHTIQKMVDYWRSGEHTELQLLMLRLQLWRVELKEDVITLSELSPVFVDHPLGTVHVCVPEDGYELPQPEQLSEEQWVARVGAATLSQGWAWASTNNEGAPDGCLMLFGAEPFEHIKIVINVQSRRRITPEPVSEAAIKEEVVKVPVIKDDSVVQMLLYVTDQHPSMYSKVQCPLPIGDGVTACPIFRQQQEEMWGGAIQIRDMLLGKRRKNQGCE